MATAGAEIVTTNSSGPGQAATLASAGAGVLWFEALADAGGATMAFEAARPSGTSYVLTFDARQSVRSSVRSAPRR